jgi:hypothetical protein
MLNRIFGKKNRVFLESQFKDLIGWSFSRNTFDESHTFVESVTSLYHFSL